MAEFTSTAVYPWQNQMVILSPSPGDWQVSIEGNRFGLGLYNQFWDILDFPIFCPKPSSWQNCSRLICTTLLPHPHVPKAFSGILSMFHFLMAFIAPWILSQNPLLKHVVLIPEPSSYQNKSPRSSVLITLLCCYSMLSAQSLGCFWLCSWLSQPWPLPLFVTLFSPSGPQAQPRGCVRAPVPSSPIMAHPGLSLGLSEPKCQLPTTLWSSLCP